jgi:DNA-directed RNA polymerase specialized sigma24 family protein
MKKLAKKTNVNVVNFTEMVKDYRENPNNKTENTLYAAVQELGWQCYNSRFRGSLTREPAEEALNDVAVDVFKLPFNDYNMAYFFVKKCCYNALFDEVRKNKKYRNTDSYSVTENSEPEMVVAARRLEKKVHGLPDTKDDDWCVPMEQLEKVLATLSGKDKLVATETLNGLTPEQISKKHGLKLSVVYNHKHSAIKKLKREIKRLGL